MLSHIWGIFSFSFSSSFSVLPSPQPPGPFLSLEVHIPALRPKFHPQGPNPNPKAQIPLSRDLGLKTGIWASRLRYGPGGWGEGGTKKEKKKEEKKIPICVKA